MKIKILDSLPKSHKWSTINPSGKIIKGIIWDEQDTFSKNTILLYTDWSNIHFDSNWYELTAQDVASSKNTIRDIEFLLNIFKEYKVDPSLLIDVHCGSGRHLFELAKMNMNLVGLEGADLLRNIAIEKAKKIGAKIQFHPTFNTYIKKFAEKADVVTTFFNSMGYTFNKQDDIDRLTWIANLLKPDGLLFIDYRSGEFQTAKYASPITTKDIITIPNNDINVLCTTRKVVVDNILGATESITTNKQGQIKIVQQTSYGWRLYSISELSEMLLKCGIKLEKVVYSYYENESMNGERVFLIGRKQS